MSFFLENISTGDLVTLLGAIGVDISVIGKRSSEFVESADEHRRIYSALFLVTKLKRNNRGV